MYNWYAVNTWILCPTGWHVPADAEWAILIDYLGGEQIAGGKLKETEQYIGLALIQEQLTKVVLMLSSGDRIGADGSFYNIGGYAIYWSNDESSPTQAVTGF